MVETAANELTHTAQPPPRLGPLCAQAQPPVLMAQPAREDAPRILGSKVWLPERPGVPLCVLVWEPSGMTPSGGSRAVFKARITRWSLLGGSRRALWDKGKLTLSPSDGAISCAQSGDEAARGGLPGRMGRLESRPLAPPGPSLAALVCHRDSGFRLRFHRAQGSPAPEDEHHLS